MKNEYAELMKRLRATVRQSGTEDSIRRPLREAGRLSPAATGEDGVDSEGVPADPMLPAAISYEKMGRQLAMGALKVDPMRPAVDAYEEGMRKLAMAPPKKDPMQGAADAYEKAAREWIMGKRAAGPVTDKPKKTPK